MNAEDRFWADLVDRLPDDRLGDFSYEEAGRQLDQSDALGLDPEVVERILDGMRSRRRTPPRRRPWRIGLVAAAVLVGFGFLYSAGLTTVLWPSNRDFTERVGLPVAIELMLNPDESLPRRELAMARVHRYGLAAVAELQSFMAAQDPDLGPTAAQYLRFLRAVFDGKDTSPEFDPAFDFGEQARIARRESEPPEVRREALARVVSQAACAIRSLRVVAASEDDELAGAVRPELDRIRELFESRPNGRTVR